MSNKWAILSVVMLGGLMGPLDGTIVNIALPTIAHSFHSGLTASSWVVTAYLLAVTTLLLTWGRLGDLLGLKPVYLAGFAGFGVASVLCAFAPSLGWLIAFRILQGAAGGLMFAVAPGLLASSFPGRERGRALGFFGMTTAAGLTAGPALGGLIVAATSWRAIFLINLPIALLGTLWGARVLKRRKPVPRQTFDVLGAVLAAVALLALLALLAEGPRAGIFAPSTLISLTVTVAATVAFVARERVARHPMVDLTLFRSATFSSSIAAVVLNFAALFTALFLVPFDLLQIRHWSPGQAGLLLSVLPAALFVMAPVSGTLSDRFGTRLLTTGGMLLSAAALALLALAPGNAGPLDLGWRLLLVGAGLGLFQPPNTSAALGAVPPNRLGVGGGVLATARNLGMMMGVALGQAVFTIRLAADPRSGGAAAAMSYALMAGAALAALGALVAWQRPHGEAQPSGVGDGRGTERFS